MLSLDQLDSELQVFQAISLESIRQRAEVAADILFLIFPELGLCWNIKPQHPAVGVGSVGLSHPQGHFSKAWTTTSRRVKQGPASAWGHFRDLPAGNLLTFS